MMLPFLSAREHVSKYSLFSPGFTSPSQDQEVCISVLRPASWLVNRNWTGPDFVRLRDYTTQPSPSLQKQGNSS